MQLTMDVNIENVKFEEVLPMWERLWPGRDIIRPTNSMLDFDGTIDMTLYDKAADGIKWYDGVFWAAVTHIGEKRIIIGVNGGFQTSETSFRSRGLYVEPAYGGKGIGTMLLKCTVAWAKEQGFETVWSFPKKKAAKTYKAAGFTLGKLHEDEESYTSSGVTQYESNYEATAYLK